MNTNNTPLVTSYPSAVAGAGNVGVTMLESGPPTHLTSAYPEVSLSNQRAISQRETGPSLLLSDPNIPKSTYESSSPSTTGAQQSTSSGIPRGQPSKDSSLRSEKSYRKAGFHDTEQLGKQIQEGVFSAPWIKPVPGPAPQPTTAGLKLPPEQPALLYKQDKLHQAYDAAVKEHDRLAAQGVGLGGQVAGSHYTKLKIQPIEYVHANNIGYCEGSVIKYVSRWRDKGGLEDLRKAKHFLDILIELETKNAI